MSHPLLQVNSIAKSFGEPPLLDIAGMEVQYGKSYALIGDNGSGKTTLLRILAGLEPAIIREYFFAGRLIPGGELQSWIRHKIVYVHQHPYLFTTTVAENVAYGLKARGENAPVRKALVKEALEWAGITHLAQTATAKLSGGEKQRVALARAKVLNPQLLLLDEPTANLDTQARSQIISLIYDLEGTARALIIATHDRNLVHHANYRLHLANGRLLRVVEEEVNTPAV